MLTAAAVVFLLCCMVTWQHNSLHSLTHPTFLLLSLSPSLALIRCSSLSCRDVHKHHHIFHNPTPFAVIADEWMDQFIRSMPMVILVSARLVWGDFLHPLMQARGVRE